MEIQKFVTYLFFYVYLPFEGIPAQSSKPADELDEILELRRSQYQGVDTPSYGLVSLLNPINVLTGVLNLFTVKPDPLEADFWAAVDLANGVDEDADPEQAAKIVMACALKGNAIAMYHVGKLMTLQADLMLQPLAKYIGFDSITGKAYLKAAEKKGFKTSLEAQENFKSLKNMNLIAQYSYGIDTVRFPFLASRLLKQSIENNNPYACLAVAEVSLNRQECLLISIPLNITSPFEKRRNAVRLLEVAVQHNLYPAQNLLESVREEDRLYEEICRLLMVHKDIVLMRNDEGVFLCDEDEEEAGLALGDSGFQEAFLDLIYEKQILVLNRVLSQEQCELYKQAMAFRVKNLFYLYSSYFQYCNQLSIKHDQESFQRNFNAAINRQIVRAPIALNCVTGRATSFMTVNVFTSGVLASFMQSEVDAAYRKLIMADSDFDDIEVGGKPSTRIIEE